MVTKIKGEFMFSINFTSEEQYNKFTTKKSTAYVDYYITEEGGCGEETYCFKKSQIMYIAKSWYVKLYTDTTPVLIKVSPVKFDGACVCYINFKNSELSGACVVQNSQSKVFGESFMDTNKIYTPKEVFIKCI